MNAERLIQSVKSKFPNASVEVQNFDSGAVMVDVRMGSKLFVCSYSPTNGFGVDQATSDSGFDSTFTHAAKSVDEAAAKLIELIENAQAATRTQWVR